MAKVMISLPDDLLARLDARATEHGRTRSATLRELAEAGLRTRELQLAARMATLQEGARPHGGRAAEQIKAGRPA